MRSISNTKGVRSPSVPLIQENRINAGKADKIQYLSGFLFAIFGMDSAIFGTNLPYLAIKVCHEICHEMSIIKDH